MNSLIVVQPSSQTSAHNQDFDISDLKMINGAKDPLFNSILNFAENIEKNSHDLDTDFARIINDNIVDLLA